jgi:hypothetical protein
MKQIIFTVLMVAGGFAQDTPRIVNAQMQQVAVGASLQQTVDSIVQQQKTPAWMGYSIPTVPKQRYICCFDSTDQFWRQQGCCNGCRLEGHDGNYFNSGGDHDKSCTGKLEPSRELYVLIRAENGELTRFRTVTPECGLDAGGLPFRWITGVNPKDSLRFLDSQLPSMKERPDHKGKRRLAEHVLGAIAMHDDPGADEILTRVARSDESMHLREQALFWLGSERGRKGFEIVREVARNSTDDRLREHATFALSTSEETEAADELIRMAKADPASRVRGQALFWLAQKAGSKAAAAITDSMENDPDLDVKKKAVFALSQMPKDDGVPRLIAVARTHKNHLIRKEAIFWLGESEDPRALDFLEEFIRGK